MAGSHPGAGRMPGVQNNQMGPGQQGAPFYDKQYVGRVPPGTTDNVTEIRTLVENNKKLQGGITQIAELSKQKLKVANSKIQKLEEQLRDVELKLVEASQNYENAKVVVLTYKTRNIHLESAANELEVSLSML